MLSLPFFYCNQPLSKGQSLQNRCIPMQSQWPRVVHWDQLDLWIKNVRYKSPRTFLTHTFGFIQVHLLLDPPFKETPEIVRDETVIPQTMARDPREEWATNKTQCSTLPTFCLHLQSPSDTNHWMHPPWWCTSLTRCRPERTQGRE